MVKKTGNSIAIKICESYLEAPDYKQGLRGGAGFIGAELTDAIIVRKGMESGNDTIDLHFVDQDGKKYIAMTTARLLKTVTDLCIVENQTCQTPKTSH